MSKIMTLLAALFVWSAVTPQLGFPQAGKSGLSFLKLGVSGRGAAMADAMTGHVSGAASTYYNPAGLAASEAVGSTAQLMIMHKEWIQDIRAEFLGVRVALGDRDALGFSVNSTTVSEIEIRTRPGDPEGTFVARNYSLGVSYARLISDDLTAGLTAKFLYEKILIDEASGFACDLGMLYKTPLENLSVGAAISNLGTLNELRNEKTKLPSLVRIGPAYVFEVSDIRSTVTIASDFLYVLPETSSFISVGGEFLFNHAVAARMGYQFGSQGRHFTAGVGILHGIFALDYAYSPLSFDLGNGHTVSLALNL